MNARRLIIVAAICGLVAGIVMQCQAPDPEAVTTSEQLLAVCFPHRIYRADAAPICPAFRHFIIEEANRNAQSYP